MEIGLIVFEISKIGGIATVHKRVKTGLINNGHNVTDYFVTLNKSKLPEKTPIDTDKTLGFMSDELLNEAKAELKEKDLLIFSHPCPTKNKAFDSTRWMDFYKLGTKNISIAHEPFIEQYYPWFLDVKEYVHGIACVQQKAYDPMIKHFDNVIITNHFLDLSDMGDYRDLKEDLVICPHQFKTWKHVDKFIRAIPMINHKVEVFNGGIEYHYMSGSIEKRKDKYRDGNGWIWENAINAGMNYRGIVSDEEIKKAFQRAKCSIDLSVGELGTKMFTDFNQMTLFGEKAKTYKSVNYVPLESMKYGTIPIVRQHSLVDGLLTKENCIVLPESNLIENTAKTINQVIEKFDQYLDVYGVMINNNFELLKKEYDANKNVRKIIDM